MLKTAHVRSLALAPLTPLFLACPLVAGVIEVRGANPDYDQISTAVLNAENGDVIRVWPGSNYEAFTIDNKSLSIIGTGIRTEGITIRNLASNRSVSLSGIGTNVGSTGPRTVLIENCLGSVRLRDGNFVGGVVPFDHGDGDISYEGWPAAQIFNSRDVVMNRCTMRGGYYPGGDHFSSAGAGLNVVGGQLALYDCFLEGQSEEYDGATALNNYGGNGHVFASGCTFIGGDGGDGWFDSWSGTSYAPGNGGHGYWGGFGTEGHLLDCTFYPGSGGADGGSGYGQAPDGSPHVNAKILPGKARLLKTTKSMDDQSLLVMDFQGTPGEVVSYRLETMATFVHNGQLGPRLVGEEGEPFPTAWRIVGRIGANGTLQFSLPVLDLAPFGHRKYYIQGRVFGVESYHTASDWTILIDSAW